MIEIQKVLFAHRDSTYAEFIAGLIPDLPAESFIGVRSLEYKEIHKVLPEKQVLDSFLMSKISINSTAKSSQGAQEPIFSS